MSASTYVQFVRNFLCVAKSLLPLDHVGHGLIFPKSTLLSLQSVTFLEFFIAITQALAVYFNLVSGTKHLWEGVVQRTKLVDWGNALKLEALSNPKAKAAEISILNSIITRDLNQIWLNKLVLGFFELIFGISFAFLVANSLHIHGPTHPKPVIDALIAMEVGLVYILGLMATGMSLKSSSKSKIESIKKVLTDVKDKETLSFKSLIALANSSGFDDDYMTIFSLLDISYSPVWRTGASVADNTCEIELEKLSAAISDVIPSSSSLNSFGKGSKQKAMKVLGVKDLPACISSLNDYKRKAADELILDIIYFALNFIAGYGYLMGIVVFYFPHSIYDRNAWVKALLLGLSHADGDWYGNFAGDAAWTIEPLIAILISWNLLTFTHMNINNSSKGSTTTEKKKSD